MSNSPEMLRSAPGPQAGWEALSLLGDGRASPEQTRQALDLWARDAAAQERWQTWHLIGDVMRSADLAPAHAPGDVFLPQLRARLQAQGQGHGQAQSQAQQPCQEPLHGEPASPVLPLSFKPVTGGRSWFPRASQILLVVRSMLVRGWTLRGPLIAGGGVAALTLVLMVGLNHPWDDGASSSILSLEVAHDRRGPLAAASQEAAEPVWRAADGQLIRDARLDSYLRAHRSGGPAVPGGATGRFETVALER